MQIMSYLSKFTNVLIVIGIQIFAISVLLRRFDVSQILGIKSDMQIGGCGWLNTTDLILLSQSIVTPTAIVSGYVHIKDGKIVKVHTGELDKVDFKRDTEVINYGKQVISPGVMDVHVHFNEPGRTDWEGITKGSTAAAAGGITTVIDMPLNSHPCTTNVKLLQQKMSIATNKAKVEMGFWAGLVPQNSAKPPVLTELINKGAVGFKAFMSPSGIRDFPNVSVSDIERAIPVINELGVPLMLHAEVVSEEFNPKQNPQLYSTFLTTRPPKFEQHAIQLVIHILQEFQQNNRFKKGFGIHIAHLGDGGSLDMLKQAQQRGLPITVETCAHYLAFNSESINLGSTQFKCMPPIRTQQNQDALWQGIEQGIITSVSSDHSPAPPSMKQLESGDFMKAWGGISGVQYLLPATWSAIQKKSSKQLSSAAMLISASQLLSKNPAKLLGVDSYKGQIREGYDADLVIWDPYSFADTSQSGCYHNHKVTPYRDIQLYGKVLATFAKGQQVFNDQDGPVKNSCGFILRK